MEAASFLEAPASSIAKWWVVHKYEILDILYDFEGYICCIQAVNLSLDIYSVCTFIIYLENKHITNEKLVKRNFCYGKLKNTVIKIIQELNEELD